MHRAALAISSELELAPLLRAVVRTGAALVGARFAALGIPDRKGGFGTFVHTGIGARQARRIGALPHAHGILGALVREDRAIRVRDIRADPRFRYYPGAHPVMREFLGVPIRRGREIVGNLFFSGSRDGRFTGADQRIAEMLAAHAAVAIATARRHADAAVSARAERERVAEELRDAILAALALPRGTDAASRDTPPLSRRERDVLALIVDGAANKQIAASLSLSGPTVKTHVSNILRKLGAQDRTQAAVMAVRQRLI